MSDGFDMQSRKGQDEKAIYMAYTLNNTQPVRCTYVSEEPLFYLDAPVADDESDIFEGELPADFLLDLTEDHRFEPLALTMDDTLDLFKQQFFRGRLPETQDLAATIEMMRASRFAAEMLDFAERNKIEVLECDQMAAISYDRHAGRITLRPGQMVHEQVLLLSRELRRVWQHRQGALIHPLLFHPDHAIVINRVQAADLMVAMVRTAWELRLSGQPAVWDYLDQSGHHDLTRAYARDASVDFRALNDGRAAAAVFEAWFLSERCRVFDRRLIQQMLADYQSYVAKAGHEETSKVLTHQLIAALGAMPYGKNYLSSHAVTILADPIFTDIRDRSNANFLWFIKFEQSFRQTERDLQSEKDLSHVSKDRSSHVQSSAVIINLPVVSGDDLSVASGSAGRVSGGAVIVDLSGWRARTVSD